MSELVRVGSQSYPPSVAGAIAGIMRQHGHVEIQAVGAAAVNQAIKAITVARSYLEQNHIDLCVIPHFVDIEIDGVEKTAIRFAVIQRMDASQEPQPAFRPEPALALAVGY